VIPAPALRQRYKQRKKSRKEKTTGERKTAKGDRPAMVAVLIQKGREEVLRVRALAWKRGGRGSIFRVIRREERYGTLVETRENLREGGRPIPSSSYSVTYRKGIVLQQHEYRRRKNKVGKAGKERKGDGRGEGKARCWFLWGLSISWAYVGGKKWGGEKLSPGRVVGKKIHQRGKGQLREDNPLTKIKNSTSHTIKENGFIRRPRGGRGLPGTFKDGAQV